MDDFDMRFNEMMSSAIEYEKLKKSGKNISKHILDRMKKSSDWLNNLSKYDYDRLIH